MYCGDPQAHRVAAGARETEASMRTHGELYPTIKRALDFTLSILIGIVALPVLGLMMLLVRLTSRGPVIYSQTRVGLDGREFPIYKIRSMYQDAELRTGPQWATENDPRITPVGRFLRKSHLDELPQLWNILRGEMSLVGPRPERPSIIVQLEEAIPHYRERLRVRPGVTGLAQIQLPPDTDLESVRRKLSCDLHYVENVDFWLDFRTLLVTGLGLTGLPYAAGCRMLGIPSTDDIESNCKVVRVLSSRAVFEHERPSTIEPVTRPA